MLLAAPIIALAVKAAQLYNQAPDNVKKQASDQWNQTPVAKIGNAISDSFFGKNGLFTNPEGAWDQFKNGKTNEIAQQNYELQKDNLDYTKALQQKIFEREDTSYQRTVNDMRMAGLNPVSMNGTNGAGEAISTQAPQNNYSDTGNLQALTTIFNGLQQAISTNSNASLQSANANLLNAQADNQRIKNLYEESILKAGLLNTQYDNQSKFYGNLNSALNLTFNQGMGWTENTPDWLKLSSLLGKHKLLNYNLPKSNDVFHYLRNGYYYDYGNAPSDSLDMNQAASDFRENQLLNMLFSIGGSLPSALLNLLK